MFVPEIAGIEKVERFPITISANGQDHVLEDHYLASSSGNYIIAAVYNLLDENHLLETMQNTFCGIIAINTERINRTYVLLEPKLEKKTLYLTCIHPDALMRI